jgi:hypothetical protein
VAEAVFCWLRDLQSVEAADWIKSGVRRFEEAALSFGETDRLPRFYLFKCAGKRRI